MRGAHHRSNHTHGGPAISCTIQRQTSDGCIHHGTYQQQRTCTHEGKIRPDRTNKRAAPAHTYSIASHDCYLLPNGHTDTRAHTQTDDTNPHRTVHTIDGTGHRGRDGQRPSRATCAYHRHQYHQDRARHHLSIQHQENINIDRYMIIGVGWNGQGQGRRKGQRQGDGRRQMLDGKQTNTMGHDQRQQQGARGAVYHDRGTDRTDTRTYTLPTPLAGMLGRDEGTTTQGRTSTGPDRRYGDTIGTHQGCT